MRTAQVVSEDFFHRHRRGLARRIDEPHLELRGQRTAFRPLLRVPAIRQDFQSQRGECSGRTGHLVRAPHRQSALAVHYPGRVHRKRPVTRRESIRHEDFPIESRSEQVRRSLVELASQIADPDFQTGRFIAFHRIGRDFHLRKIIVLIAILRAVEKRGELIELVVLDGFVGMRMALDAAESRALPGGPGGAHAVDHRRDSEFLVVRAALGIALGVAVKRGRQTLIRRGIRQ